MCERNALDAIAWYWKKYPNVETDILTILNEVPKSEPEEGWSPQIPSASVVAE